MPTADFTSLDTKRDVSPAMDGAEPTRTEDDFIGKQAVTNRQFDGFFAFDLNSGGSRPAHGDLATSARMHTEQDADQEGPFGFSSRIYELDPEAAFSDWYTTEIGFPGPVWRGAHHLDLDVVIEVAVDGVSVDNTGIGSTEDTVELLRDVALSGQSVGAGDQIGCLVTYNHTGSRRIRHLDLELRRFGTWDGTETITAELWTVKAGGGGKYNLEPDALDDDVQTRNVLSDVNAGSHASLRFSNGTMPTVANFSQHIVVLKGNWTPNGDKYVSARIHGNADGQNNNEPGGKDCALLTYGQEQGMNRHTYPDGLNLADLTIFTEPAVRTYSNLGAVAGDVLDGGTFGDINLIFQRALDRSGWGSNRVFGIRLDTVGVFSGHRLHPAFFGTPGRANPFLRVTWTAYVPPTITNLPPSPLTILIGTTFALTATGNSVTGRTLVWSITQAPAGAGGPATINPSTGEIAWTPLYVGQEAVFRITVSDDIGVGQTVTWTHTVLARAEPLPLVAVPEVDPPGRPLEVSAASVAALTVESASRADLEIMEAALAKPQVLPAGPADVTIGDASPGDLDVEEAEPE